MKNTFLIYKPQKDGRAVLCTATAEEWLAAVNTNRNLPTEQRRYFISDCIEDGKEIDRMIIEVGYDEYRRWNSRHTIMERSRKAGKQYQHLSLDAVLSEADEITLLECLSGTENMEAAVIDDILMDELKKTAFQLEALGCGYAGTVSRREEKILLSRYGGKVRCFRAGHPQIQAAV